MNIFSRRKRLLNRTSARVNSGPTVSGRAQFRKIFRRNRIGTPGMPKMSSRRQFHRALRRHPAWPMVMEQAAARAKLQKEQEAARARARKAFSRARLRRKLRQKRALVVALLAVGGLVALLTGISMAQGEWFIVNPLEQAPSPRFGAATAWDAVNDEMVVFGGFGTNVGSGAGLGGLIQPRVAVVNQGDTRAFKYATRKWFNRTEAATRSPLPRGYAAMAYDAARKNIVLFGGATYRATASVGAVFGETWTWDGKDWTLQNPPEPRPEARQNHVMAYDAHRKVVVMFGGRGINGSQIVPLNDTWTWDGSRWKIMPSAGAPAPRHSAAMAYDICNAQAVMFGGVAGVTKLAPEARETWTWDGEKWTPRTPAVSPLARIGASMAYSSRTGRVLMYGGLTTDDVGTSSVAADPDVWRWDGAGGAWEKTNSDALIPAGWLASLAGQASVTLLPPPRAYASFAGRHVDHDDGFNPRYSLFGGTPMLDGGASNGPNQLPQAALGDHFLFSESAPLIAVANKDEPDPVAGDTPLTRRCANPVPIPPDDAPVGGPEAPKVEIREGMRELAQLPVLLGIDWPEANRNTHNFGSTPNPNYTPAPDCPSRPDGEETGSATHLVTDSKRNKVYQFFLCDPRRGSGYYQAPGQTSPAYQAYPQVHRLLIKAYDGATLKPLGSAVVTLGSALVTQGSTDQVVLPLVHDPGRGHFLLRTTNNELIFIQQDLIEKGVDPVVRKIPLAGTVAMMSFFDHPKSGRPKLLINRGGTSLSQLDLETNTVDYNATTTGCTSIDSTQFGSPLRPTRSGDLIYVGCSGTVGGTNRAGVVRIPIIQNPDGSETPGVAEVFPGPGGVSGTWNDPETERVVLMSGGGGSRLYVWVFDGKASRYVGYAGIKQVTYNFGYKFNFDPEVGRLYALISDEQNIESGRKVRDQGGVLMLDTRLTPVSQALRFPQFAAVPGTGWGEVGATLPSGPGVPRRVFMRRGEGTMRKYPDGETINMPNEMFYRVLADEIPVPDNSELSDLDALTIGVAENPNKTEIAFDAEGGAYGIRLRGIGGILLNDGVRPFVPACISPDRELMAGWVPQARLSDLDALARSSGLEVDSNSKTDLKGPFSRCNPTADASNLPPSIKPVVDALWPLWGMVQIQGNAAVGPQLAWDKFFHEVECVGDSSQSNEAKLGDLTLNGGGLFPTTVTAPTGATATVTAPPGVTPTATAPTGGKVPIGGVTSSATCNQKGDPKDDWVAATSRGALGGSASSDAFSVGEGYSNVVVGRDPVKGVVVTATAVATGIKLPGITIGHVTTTAVAWSNGRPGTGRASFSRKICNVYPPPLPVNPQDSDERAPNTGCLNDKQQKKMVDDFNARMGINGKMILPIYDSELFTGSPGGYIAGVIKPAADEIEDQLFAKDFQREVAGLVIDFYKGAYERQSLQLAAVRAVAGLGVQCNSELVYSASSKDCVALTFEDDPVIEEFEDEESSSDDTAFNTYDEGEAEGTWTPVEATGTPKGLALGRRLGRYIQTLPIIRQLPIRAVGEAALAASVWMLLGMPLVLASRRFALNLARRS